MKGICFKEPLFMATIEGKKTQTRRIMSPQPSMFRHTITSLMQMFNLNPSALKGTMKPRYKVGEVVYLKEPYFKLSNIMFYKYDSTRTAEIAPYLWKNKLFMPTEAARYFIRITAVRAEKLQDISDKDCIKEGIEKIGPRSYMFTGLEVKKKYDGDGIASTSPQVVYKEIIDRINGKGTWASNPWVWVYDYELTVKEL